MGYAVSSIGYGVCGMRYGVHEMKVEGMDTTCHMKPK